MLYYFGRSGLSCAFGSLSFHYFEHRVHPLLLLFQGILFAIVLLVQGVESSISFPNVCPNCSIHTTYRLNEVGVVDAVGARLEDGSLSSLRMQRRLWVDA